MDNSSRIQDDNVTFSSFIEDYDSLIYFSYSIGEVLASNLSTLPNLRCIIAQGHSESIVLRIVQIFQIFVSIFGIITLLLSLYKFKKKLNFLDFNFKIFVWILCGFSILHNVLTIVIHTWHQIIYIYFQGCDRLTVSWHGIILRGIQQLGTVGLNIAGAIILFDRIWASFRPKMYTKEQRKVLPYFLGILFIIPFLTIIYIFHKDVNTITRSYFTLTSSTSQEQVKNVYLSLLAINILASIGFVILLFQNKKMLKLKAHKFNVNHHFQMLSNIRSLNFSIRLMSSSFFVNLLSFSINAFYRINYDLRSYYMTSYELEATYVCAYFFKLLFYIFFALINYERSKEYLMYFHALGIAIVIIFDGKSKVSKIKPKNISIAAEVDLHFKEIQKAWQ